MISLSVIMTVYNSERYLPEAIESVLQQSFTDFEFIIVNDGSTDRSAEIINSFSQKDERIVFINRAENKKQPFSLNEGLRAARGTYIARMDSDDICLPDRFQKQMDYLKKHPEIALLGSAFQTFSSDGEGKVVQHPQDSLLLAYKSISNTFFCHPSVIFKREILDETGMYENIKAEDFDFFSRIIRRFPCSNIPEVLIQYRVSPDNRSNLEKDPIAQSAEKVYESNYGFYIPDKKLMKEFYLFHKEGKASPVQLPSLLAIAIRITNKIRKQYKYDFFSGDYFSLLLFPVKEYNFRVFKKFKRRLI